MTALGWDDTFAAALAALGDPLLLAARVMIHRSIYALSDGTTEVAATVATKLKRSSHSQAALPVVGDWVAHREGQIFHVLPRRTWLSRRQAGDKEGEQVLAANVDAALVVMGLDGDFNVRRLERYLAVAAAGGVRPIVVLTKRDLVPDFEEKVTAAQAVAPGVEVRAVSLLEEGGAAPVEELVRAGQTIALVGSSGAGKSTLTNLFLGNESQRTGAVRAHDQRGKHTTTHRQLFVTPSGVLVIDSPGIRELQLWDAAGGVDAAFADVEEVAAGCRFRDCRHEQEPGCAVRVAVETGALEARRVASYIKLKGETQKPRYRR
jgi:ribosome biogenesis GTPase / thiamine phosphate phosphatase